MSGSDGPERMIITMNPPAILGLILALALLPIVARSQSSEPNLFARSNLVAWCIVPFDSKKRGPAERAELVQHLGLSAVAYDWRPEHVTQFEQEILEYQKRGLRYFAFWGQHDEAYRLFEKHGLKPQFWLMLRSPNASTQAENVRLAVEQVLPMAQRAAKLGSTVALYNHGGWSGEPENMVAICRELRERHGVKDAGIVYNLHHGHDHVARFPAILTLLQPYLVCINLNGMTSNGDKVGKKILPLGQGELDLQLLREILDSGYRGPIGILGHTQNDVEDQLRDNLDGLDWLVAQLEGRPAGPKPQARTLR